MAIKTSVYGLLLLVFAPFIEKSEAETFRVAYLADYVKSRPPYRWLWECTDGNVSTGTGNHLVERVFQKSGHTVEWVVGDSPVQDLWQPTHIKYQQLQKGELDFLILPQQPAIDDVKVALVTPLVIQRASIVTHISRPPYNGDLQSLATLTGGTYVLPGRHSEIYEYFNRQHWPIKSYSEDSGALVAVTKGEIDYAISEYFVAKLWERRNDVKNQLEYTDITIALRQTYLVAATNSPHAEIFSDIATAVSEYQASGFIDRLNDVYLHHWISDPCEQ
jgi:hypothetical protein